MTKDVRTYFSIAVVSLCRLVLSVTFLFSGFSKLNDPLGMCYKLNAYFAHWGFRIAETSLFLKLASVGLGVLELMLGVYLLMGIRRKMTALVTTLLMVAMTLLTIYVAVYNPVNDCGCFGSALELSNRATLLKNIVLLACAVVLLCRCKRLRRVVSYANGWIVSVYSLVFAVGLALFALHYLPPVDYTAFKVGTDMRSAYFKPSAETPGQLVAFDLSTASGENVTEEILNDTGATFILVISDLASADTGCNDRINDLYDECRDNGDKLIAVLPQHATDEELHDWIDNTGATYNFLRSDDEQLRAMVRSNPGLILLENGEIKGKWSNNNLPVYDGNKQALYQTKADNMPLLILCLILFLPLSLVVFFDRVKLGIYYIRYFIFKKRLNTTNMRKKIVAGNWKMNKNLQEGVALAKELNEILTADKPNCDVVICTPFIHLASVAAELDANVIGLGAENCADKASGAYTGEVSAEMVKSTGAQYVILGHSERRAYYGETAEILKEKINLALANGLKVIFCIGEVLEERESGKQNKVVKAQLEGSLFDLSAEEFSNIILAYEPVWAIGTGKTATADQAEDMHAFIRSVIAEKFGAEAAENVSILYGGSCKPSNAKEIFGKPNVDGGLIGGAALKSADFKGIIDAWK